MDREQIIRFITGNMNEDERKVARAWINAERANKSEFIRLKNIHAFISAGKQKVPVKEDLLLVNQRIKQASGKAGSMTFKFYLKYAALLIMAIVIGFSASEFIEMIPSHRADNLTNDFYSPEGQISEFKLSDGTRVWLNSGTRIKVPQNYDSRNRVLFIEGEAFFEVVNDPENPFYVHTPNLSVKAMGTSFNVCNYPSEGNVLVTLIEGKVGIKAHNGPKLAMLMPGQQLEYIKATGAKIKREINTSPYEAWRDGKLIFKDRSLDYIAERLERWYNVEIELKDKEVGQVKFSGTILKSKPLSQVLEIITLSAPIQYSIKVNSDQKSQVVLYSLKNKI